MGIEIHSESEFNPENLWIIVMDLIRNVKIKLLLFSMYRLLLLLVA